ncbi:MAG TPA: cupin domain-containing protein [Candidatus Nanoarchaeia archaeon]|nr:cupin domain-containing protein [Candidatus Nanoarchaeia archaeon]
MIKLENIFRDSGTKLEEELVEILIPAGRIVRLERAVSPKSDTPSKVYDQEEDEFVMLVKGYAELEFEEEGEMGKRKVVMREGDYINIPAHLKHRVIKTEEGTTCLALFYKR